MKLQNKKTGNIGVLNISNNKYQVIAYGMPLCGNSVLGEYDTLDALMQEWEDYEEPKKYWFIDAYGNIVQNEITRHYGDEYTDMADAYENQKQIGNKFETEEEANKAVEKLKAWKRLKDKRFERVFNLQLRDALCGGKTAEFKLLIDDEDLIEDIKLLLGGEEG